MLNFAFSLPRLEYFLSLPMLLRCTCKGTYCIQNRRRSVGCWLQVSEAGSVVVEKLMEVERYSHVMHISSTVTGRLLPNLDAWDALRAALPAGTVSGAPKVTWQHHPAGTLAYERPHVSDSRAR